MARPMSSVSGAFFARISGVALFVRDLQADRGGQVLDRLDEADAGVLHQEADGAAVRAAAEAVVELLGRADREGGGFLGMEGTAGAVIGARLLQRHVAFDHIDDVDAGKQFLDEAFGDHAEHYAPLSWNQVLP
jgi:hypothetical protein